MALLLRDHPVIGPSIDHLLGRDPVFSVSTLTRDHVTATTAEFNLPALARVIVGQQLSTKAANTIWSRVAAALDTSDPRAYLAMAHDDLRALGLSTQKVKYTRALAQAVHEEKLDFAALMRADNETVITTLTALPGFGPWSAQMILIFAFGRPDVWPAGDLGVREGLRLYRNEVERLPEKEAACVGPLLFGSHLSAAALLLWRLKDNTPI